MEFNYEQYGELIDHMLTKYLIDGTITQPSIIAFRNELYDHTLPLLGSLSSEVRHYLVLPNYLWRLTVCLFLDAPRCKDGHYFEYEIPDVEYDLQQNINKKEIEKNSRFIEATHEAQKRLGKFIPSSINPRPMNTIIGATR